MITRHSDYERRIGPGNDLALKRVGDSKRCSGKERKNDQRSDGEPLHSSTISAFCISQLVSLPVAVQKHAFGAGAAKNHEGATKKAMNRKGQKFFRIRST